MSDSRWSHCVALSALILQGCAQTQYEKPAKEWCLAMRANQMIPVYPLTQDVRPGDVFLVQRTIGQQVEEYKEKGFLSLDDSRKRLVLPEAAFKHQYFNGYFKGEFVCQDYPMRTPADSSVQPGTSGSVPTALTPTPAPRSAFPTYSFTVKRGVGLSLGVPISGIPVAMNFMNASEATGVVVLADSSTYQADHDEIMTALATWTSDDAVADQLKRSCEYMKQEYVYLRVVKRVYMVGAVDVRLENKQRTQGGAQAGLAEQSNDPNISYATFDENLKKQRALIKTVNDLANASKIGGAISFNLATERAVGLRESFDRPLVVGYLGMDVPYFRSGALGAPIPTFERLEGLELQDPVPLERDELLSLTRTLKAASEDSSRAWQALASVVTFGQTSDLPEIKAYVPRAQAIETLTDRQTQRLQTETMIRDLIVEMNWQAMIGSNKVARAKQLVQDLRGAMCEQGLY
jgi:hypothetical protein